ncbi:MAG: autoinducer binding domain-containing protein [Sedimenticola sp.]
MGNWQNTHLDKLLGLQSEQALFIEIAQLARDLGFDYCAYGLRLPLPVSNPKIVMFSNYPSAWQIQYMNNDYIVIDPTVRYGAVSQLPFEWSGDIITTNHQFWEEARAHGLNVGRAQSVHDHRGQIGMLTLARSHEPFSDSEIGKNGLKIASLVQMAHQGMTRVLTPKLLPESESELTPREVEILRWTAEGKTSDEISDILHISVRTVNFHIGNVIRKLNTTNKLAASVKATALGLLN